MLACSLRIYGCGWTQVSAYLVRNTTLSPLPVPHHPLLFDFIPLSRITASCLRSQMKHEPVL